MSLMFPQLMSVPIYFKKQHCDVGGGLQYKTVG